jgi:uncharacterized protein
MLESLGKIKSPLLRGITAAATVGSAIALVSAVTIDATKSKSESTYRAAVYASLMGVAGGAALGLAYSTKASAVKPSGSSQVTKSQGWQDWRNFVVVRKQQESEEITSFYLKPEDQGEIPSFQPGQFLTIKLDVPGQAKPIIRTYSLSDYCEPCEYYRLSIKREPSPKMSNLPPGLASNFMHDHIHEGSVIQAKPPSGKFILDVQKSLPAVFISNGVGITPMISMAKACSRVNPHRPLWFIHGSRNGEFHAFRSEVMTLAAQNPNLMVHYAYSQPKPEDEGHYHRKGYVDPELVRSLIMQDAEYFLCGSPPFMDSLREGLKQAGVPDSQVFFEAFTKSRSAIAESKPTATTGAGRAIVFAQSGKTVTWHEGDGNILDFAEANEVYPPYSCRQGICGTCMCKIQEGEVEYSETPTAEVDAGSILICISQPKTDKVVLEV